MSSCPFPAAAVIQWSLSSRDITDRDSFRRAVIERIETACSSPGVVLVVFPELTGLWLQMTRLLGIFPTGRAAQLLHTLTLTPVLLGGFLRKNGAAVLADQQGPESWLEPFQEAARRRGIYICPGSSFIRDNADRRIYNTSCLISPEGAVLGLRRKIHLTPIEGHLGVSSGSTHQDLDPFHTPFASVGIAICLDGFFEDVVGRLDQAGTELILQPSANSVDWNRSLKRKGYRVLQRDEWLSSGIGSLIQGRSSIMTALNPMDVTTHPLLHNSGCSTAWKRGERTPIAIAPDPRREHQLIVHIGR